MKKYEFTGENREFDNVVEKKQLKNGEKEKLILGSRDWLIVLITLLIESGIDFLASLFKMLFL